MPLAAGALEKLTLVLSLKFITFAKSNLDNKVITVNEYNSMLASILLSKSELEKKKARCYASIENSNEIQNLKKDFCFVLALSFGKIQKAFKNFRMMQLKHSYLYVMNIQKLG